MKKTLIATAIAGAMSFSVAAQAAPAVYGNIQLAVDATNDLVMSNNGSTIGFKGEETVGAITAFYKAEFEFDAASTKTADDAGFKGDQAYLGFKGDFGQVIMGSKDSLMNDFVYDAVYTGEFAVGADGIAATGKNYETQQVQYIGDFGGLKVGASMQVNKGNTPAGDQAMQVAVSMPVGDMTVSGGYETEDAGLGLAVNMPMGDMEVGAKFETSDSVDSIIAASAKVALSDMTSAYGVFSMQSAAEDTTSFGAGVTHSLTDNLYVFGEFGVENMESTVVGAVMSF